MTTAGHVSHCSSVEKWVSYPTVEVNWVDATGPGWEYCSVYGALTNMLNEIVLNVRVNTRNHDQTHETSICCRDVYVLRFF